VYLFLLISSLRRSPLADKDTEDVRVREKVPKFNPMVADMADLLYSAPTFASVLSLKETPMSSGSRPRLRRVKGKHWIGGVCAGIGYWLAVPAWIVRLVWVLLLLIYGFGGLMYILLWIFMPVWDQVPEDYEERAGG
jgi:phage shock protein PspC (stress-responsive transcriptional regulator)